MDRVHTVRAVPSGGRGRDEASITWEMCKVEFHVPSGCLRDPSQLSLAKTEWVGGKCKTRLFALHGEPFRPTHS